MVPGPPARARVSGPVRGSSFGARSPRMTIDVDRRAPPCVLMIFGASGDLTARKLLPASAQLASYGVPPPEVALIGGARTAMTDAEFADPAVAVRVPGEP